MNKYSTFVPTPFKIVHTKNIYVIYNINESLINLDLLLQQLLNL